MKARNHRSSSALIAALIILGAWNAFGQSRPAGEAAALAAQDYERTETKSAGICLLNDRAALLSAQFRRYRKDGSVLGEAAGTYVFTRLPQGWRIVASIPHAPERVLKCDG